MMHTIRGFFYYKSGKGYEECHTNPPEHRLAPSNETAQSGVCSGP